MSAKVTQLRAQIAELHEEIEHAQRAQATALDAVASNPNVGLERVRTETRRLADAQADIQVLNSALDVALAEESSDERQAQKRKAAEIYHKIETVIERRNLAAEKIDTALAAFDKSICQWLAVNADLRNQIAEFFANAQAHPRAHEHFRMVVADLPRALNNALAAGLEQAVRPCEVHQSMEFRFVTERGQPYPTADDAARSGQRALAGLSAVAQQAGLSLDAAQ